ncbi:MAG: phosphate ABC transporter ATP-binding protein PstB [Candidatus Nitrosocaldus sp.]|nr:phosphate ABC transporter ATP-binding protein PstB [Candidatus Nitrosocaldus sp.]MDW8000698.1 phosphate ABC transporter ATP-binding protein PstB [Candidatus Nitrosocaldus sp.]
MRLWSLVSKDYVEKGDIRGGRDVTVDDTMNGKIVLEGRMLGVVYGSKYAIRDVNIKIVRNTITAIIGPSGCGKSTLLRCFNRMNDLLDARIEGEILFNDHNIYSDGINVAEVRRLIGMVFQKPNPFPTSIYNNVAFGLKINGFRGDIGKQVEYALREAALWDEVKDRLNDNAYSLSGGQQQRLCIARALAVEPEVLLMDEPTASLDPIASAKIEQLITRLKEKITIIIVTHNIQQAARVSDYVNVMMIDENMIGRLIESGPTREVFESPKSKVTEDYISGRFG